MARFILDHPSRRIICLVKIRDELRDDLSVCHSSTGILPDEFPRKRDEKAWVLPVNSMLAANFKPALTTQFTASNRFLHVTRSRFRG